MNFLSSGRKQWILFSVLIGVLISLSVGREPLFFAHPRLWAEEGSIHVQAVLAEGAVRSVFLPHVGYYSFLNNLVMALGVPLVGLDDIAYLTTYVSAAFIFLTLLAPMLLPSSYWAPRWKACALAIFMLTVGAGEIWVNIVNLQFYLSAFACLVLLSDTDRLHAWVRCYVVAMLAIAASTGITTVVLFPFFALLLYQKKNRSHFDWLLFGVVAAGLLVQVGAVYHEMTHGAGGRLSLANLPNLPRAAFNIITAFVVANTLTKLVVLAGMAWLLFKSRAANFRLFVPALIAIYLGLLFAATSSKMWGGERYSYVSAVLMFIFLLNIEPAKGRGSVLAFKLVLAAIMTLSFFRFFDTSKSYDPQWTKYSVEGARENDRGEVEVRIFPQSVGKDAWLMKLPRAEYEKYKY